MQNSKEGKCVKSFNYEQRQLWLKQLSQSGVVVVKNVLNNNEVQNAINLFWQWIEALGTKVKRGQPQTWEQQNWPGLNRLGFFATYGGCHNKASWFIRCHEKVRGIFSQIWQTKDLITSFDTFIGWKPWWINPKWKPSVQNLHVDQNPDKKKGLKCIQGMVPLKRVRQIEAGGLMVVPNTNNDSTQKQLCERYPYMINTNSDWLELDSKDPYILNKRGILVQCDAGDMILWDSRTIHGGKICQPSEEFKQKNKGDFVRLSMTITMVPRSWAKQGILKRRQEAFMNKVGLTHWPHEYNKSGMGQFLPGIQTQKIKYDWPKLEGDILSLV